jgi:hypothetical protein
LCRTVVVHVIRPLKDIMETHQERVRKRRCLKEFEEQEVVSVTVTEARTKCTTEVELLKYILYVTMLFSK